ncbi:MAG: invasion associated locus B family protein [Alphaproteobacteria bacterium]
MIAKYGTLPLAIVFGLLTGAAFAQEVAPAAPTPAAPAPAAPAAASPAARTAPARATAQGQQNATDVQTIGDWTVRCFPIKAPAPCDMIQVAISKEKKQKVSSVSLAYVPSRDNYALQVVVPLGVSFAAGLTLSSGDRKIEGLKFRRCQNDGCYVETGMTRAAVEGLPAGGNSGAITVALYRDNKQVGLPLSFNGFGQALAKMKDLARAKAVATPPAAPASAPAAAPPQQ